MRYDYYVSFLYPKYVTKDNPAGILRTPSGAIEFEAFERDNKWRASTKANFDITQGDLDIKKVSKEHIKKLLKTKLNLTDDRIKELVV